MRLRYEKSTPEEQFQLLRSPDGSVKPGVWGCMVQCSVVAAGSEFWGPLMLGMPSMAIL